MAVLVISSIVFGFLLSEVDLLPQYTYNTGSAFPSFGQTPGGLISNIVPSHAVAQDYLPPTLSPFQSDLPHLKELAAALRPPIREPSGVIDIPQQTAPGRLLISDQSNTLHQHNSVPQHHVTHNNVPQSNALHNNVVHSNVLQSNAPHNNAPHGIAPHNNVVSHQRSPIITKDIYVHVPPEDDEDQELEKQIAAAPIHKNYRIIFIKAPSTNIKAAAEALKRAQAVNEERTVIYVLTKKADLTDLQKELKTVQNNKPIHSKPEVYFIKYKTNEEANRAQQAIQAQYDALGGTTKISHEGPAPVATFNSGQALASNIAGTPSQIYLPPTL